MCGMESGVDLIPDYLCQVLLDYLCQDCYICSEIYRDRSEHAEIVEQGAVWCKGPV